MSRIERIALSIKKMYNSMTNKDKGLIAPTIIYMFTFSMLDVIVAFFLKILLDLYLKNISSKGILIFIASFLILGCFLGVLNNIIRQTATARIGYLRIDYLADAFNKIITCDYKNMEDSTFLNKYDSAFDACSNAESGIEKVYNILFESPALILKVLIFAFILGRFSLMVIFASLIHAIVSFFVKKQSATYKYKYKEEFSKVNRKKKYFNNVSQDFQYGKDIRLYNLKDIISEKYEKEINEYKLLFTKVKNKELLFNFVTCLTLIVSDLVIYMTLVLNFQKGISISDITMYFIVVNMFSASLNLVITNASTIYGEGLFIADYFDFIDANLCKEKGLNLSFNYNRNLGIRIRNLSFKYPNTDRYIFRNLNLDISPGEKIALVGQNGVGKSTLIKILAGLFRDFEGDIFIGEVSIREFSTKSLYEMFSVVFQETNLLAYTVNENITGSSKNSDEHKVWDILAQVGMKERIERTEKGLEQIIHKYIAEDGLELSGGESQKLGIARAMYKDSAFYILDEPTASLDAIAEKEIYQEFGKITHTKTTIFISHRLASTKFCDRIILVGENGVLEQGTHAELMKKKGIYFEMFSLQGKYYQENKNEKNKAFC